MRLNKKHQQQMKGNISFLILIAISFCGYAQKAKPKVVYETIIVYDTITVYDTIFVYDTIKTENKVQSENNFKNNFTAEKAYLAIDTNNFSAAVLLINKKDTATLSINSIILSETNKNLDTMKKSLLTLLVSAALTQAASAQTRKADTLSFPKTFSVGAGLCLSDANFGAMVKADYLKNKKISFGLRSHRTIKSESNNTLDSGGVYNNFTSPETAIAITATYYFGKKGVCSKTGLYFTGGLEFQNNSWGYQLTNSPFAQHYHFEQNTLGLLTCVGVDYKMGSGKLYFDVQLLSAFYSKYRTRGEFGTSKEDRTDVFKKFEPLTSGALNLGYAFYF